MEKCAAMREEGYISMNPIISNIITADKGGTAAQSDRNRARATACHSKPCNVLVTTFRAMQWVGITLIIYFSLFNSSKTFHNIFKAL